MRIRGLTHIGICVGNIERSVEFYKELLGFELDGEISGLIDSDEDAKGMGFDKAITRVAIIQNKETGIAIELVEFVKPEPVTVSTEMNTLGKYHIAYETDDIFAVFKKAETMGCVPFYMPLLDESMGMYWGYLKDPDGTVIEITQKEIM